MAADAQPVTSRIAAATAAHEPVMLASPVRIPLMRFFLCTAILLATAPLGCDGACADGAEPTPSAGAVAGRTADPAVDWVDQVSIDPPAAEGSFAPSLTTAGRRVLATWIEPTGNGHRLRFATLAEGGWSAPVNIVSSDAMFANWADFPGVTAAGSGALIAHWLRRSGDETYAYDVVLMRSTDDGESWTELGKLHDDDTRSEHGFVSYVPTEEGVRAFWLDGRQTSGGHDGEDAGSMTLRTAEIVEDRIGPSELVDDRVCDCCQTAALSTASGPLVAFRDRRQGELRDVVVARRGVSGWTGGELLGAQRWEMRGCPVNGPAAAAAGDGVAVVVWYSGGDAQAGVWAAFSEDGGERFGDPVPIDGPRAMGRVDVAGGAGEAVISWLAPGAADDEALVRLRRVSLAGATGEAVTVAGTGSSRASGFPRLVRLDGRFLVAWVETGTVSRVRAAWIDAAVVPKPSARP